MIEIGSAKNLEALKPDYNGANLTQAMLEKKEVWNGVDEIRAEPTTSAQIRNKDNDNAIATKSSSKASVLTSTSTSSEKIIHNGNKKLFVEYALKSVRA